MKKIAGKIAMILVLVLVMLAGMFTNCYFTQWDGKTFLEKDNGFLVFIGVLLFIPCFVLDIIALPFQFFWWLGGQGRSVSIADSEALLRDEECAILTEMRASLPEEDGAFLMALIAAIPEAERSAALEQINAIPKHQFTYMVKTIRSLYALPQAKRIFLLRQYVPFAKRNKFFYLKPQTP
jgi:hypothetical protein